MEKIGKNISGYIILMGILGLFHGSRSFAMEKGHFVDAKIPSISVEQFFYAVAKDQVEIVLQYLQTGGDINVVNKHAWTALKTAAYYNAQEVAKFLLEHGTNPNVPDEFNWTPLMTAAARGYDALACSLLDYGADPDAIHTFFGKSAIQFAEAYGFPKVAQTMRARIKCINQLKTDIRSASNDQQSWIYLLPKELVNELIKFVVLHNKKPDHRHSSLSWCLIH